MGATGLAGWSPAPWGEVTFPGHVQMWCVFLSPVQPGWGGGTQKTVTFVVEQQVSFDVGAGGYTPTRPGWSFRKYVQSGAQNNGGSSEKVTVKKLTKKAGEFRVKERWTKPVRSLHFRD